MVDVISITNVELALRKPAGFETVRASLTEGEKGNFAVLVTTTHNNTTPHVVSVHSSTGQREGKTGYDKVGSNRLYKFENWNNLPSNQAIHFEIFLDGVGMMTTTSVLFSNPTIQPTPTTPISNDLNLSPNDPPLIEIKLFTSGVTPTLPLWVHERIAKGLSKHGYSYHSIIKKDGGYSIYAYRTGSFILLAIAIIVAVLLIFGVRVISWTIVEVSRNAVLMKQEETDQKLLDDANTALQNGDINSGEYVEIVSGIPGNNITPGTSQPPTAFDSLIGGSGSSSLNMGLIMAGVIALVVLTK